MKIGNMQIIFADFHGPSVDRQCLSGSAANRHKTQLKQAKHDVFKGSCFTREGAEPHQPRLGGQGRDGGGR